MDSMKAQLKNWGIEVDTLKAHADKAGAGVRDEIYRQIEHVRSMEKEASNKLQEMMKAGGPALDDISRGLEKAVRDIRNSLKGSSSASRSR